MKEVLIMESGRQTQEQLQKCYQLMSKDPVFCTPGDPVDVVAQLMLTEDIGSLPVIAGRQTVKLIGIITDRDLALKVVAEGRDPRSVTVDEVMTRQPVTCNANDEIRRALEIMAEHQVRRIPVLDEDGLLVGIIAQADIAERLGEPEKTAKVVEEISKSTLEVIH
jgi:CBS domain-containing protein